MKSKCPYLLVFVCFFFPRTNIVAQTVPLADSLQLETVNITKKKPLVERKNGKIILNVANSILAAGNSAMDILAKAPGVTIDNEGNISLRGKAGILVLIDDKPTYLSAAQLATLLRSTSGNTIQSIELISNPSSRYDAAGTGGLIHIRLKKNSNNGTNGSLAAGGGYGKYYKSDASITLNHRNHHVNLFGNFNYVSNKEFENILIDRSNTAAHEKTYFDQRGTDIYLRRNNSYKFGMDYEVNPRNIIGFAISGYTNDAKANNSNRILIGSLPFAVDSSITASNPGQIKHQNQSYNLNYKAVLDTSGQELNVDFDYTRFQNTNNFKYNNYFFDSTGMPSKSPLIFSNASPSSIHILAGKMDYTIPLQAQIKLETGIKTSYVNTDNNFQSALLTNAGWIPDAAQNNRFIYKELINAAYANLHKDFKTISIQLGLRTELTHSEGNSVTLQQLLRRNYLDFFPNMQISHRLAENHELGFSYSRRIDRPDYQSLNPFIYFADLYTYSQGNPNLNPQYANVYELSYGHKKTTNVTLGYTHTKDVMSTTTITDPIKKTLLLFEQNLASRNTVSANISRPLALTKWWNTSNDATLYYSRFSSPNLMGVPFENGKLTFLVNSLQSFIISPTINAELSVNYASSQAYGTYVADPIYGADLGISKSMAGKRMNIKLAANDVFNTRQIKINSVIPTQDYQLYQKQETRIFRFTFTYNFGSTSIKAVRERINGSASEQGRVKNGN